MRLCGSCALLLLGFLLFMTLDSTESSETVQPNEGWTVEVSTKLPLAECAVCTASGVNSTQISCHSTLSVRPEDADDLLFNCSQQSYRVTITIVIDCTEEACSPQMVEVPSSILTEFQRTFIWELKAPQKMFVSLNVLGDGLIETSQPCTNGLQYSVALSKTNIEDKTQYCRGGSVTLLKVVNEAVVSLEVKPGKQVDSVVFQPTAGPLMEPTVVSIGVGLNVVLNRDPGETECEVCILSGSTPDCSSTEKTLKSGENISLEFSCVKPQNVFNVKMMTTIGCTESTCTQAAAEVDPDLFKDFKRTMKWYITIPDRTVLTLDFPNYGLKKNSATENCQDGFQHTVSTTKYDGTTETNSYCKGGTVSKLELLGATTVTLDVPKGGEMAKTAFKVKAAQRRGRLMSVTSDPHTILLITRVNVVPDCKVCKNEGSNQKCSLQSLTLKNPYNTSVEFTCPQPQDVFNVEINRQIDCNATSCPDNLVHAENMFFPDFNRTFTWDFKTVSTRAVQLGFPEQGMRQISNQQTCPEDHTYTVVVYLRTGLTNIGTFCKGGPVTVVQALYKGRFALYVPRNVKLDPVDLKIDVGSTTTKVATVEVSLPRGVSETDFITPNYPEDFPDSQQMQWNFKVPGMHNYTVEFRDHTEPECLSGDVVVEYQNRKVVKKTLTDPQPQHQQGDFSMVLNNCETNGTLQGLSLSYKVSVMRSGHPVLCTVDLTRLSGVSLQIQKVGSDPFCEIRVNSKVTDKITVAAGTTAHLSFLDCPNEDVLLTASQVTFMECLKGSPCPSAFLMVPSLDSCLPMPLHSFTWFLNIPEDATLDLVSPTGSLRQSLPGQECNQSVSLHVAEAGGFPVGDFCSGGAIQKVQVHANVSVTVTAQDFGKTREPLLNVSVSPEITETIIYRVSPTTTTSTLLTTPNWPRGMKPFSTVSWIVTFPSQYKAQLRFFNVSQPKCEETHTSISVKELSKVEELVSRNEDDEPIEELTVPESFYLNMSNCKPEARQFAAMTQIVLQKKTHLLAILLGLLGALLVLIIVLAVVCVLLKKKKQKVKEASIYLGKGNIFRPNDRHFTKSRADNDSHVYDYIDDTLVYNHLLGDSTYSDGKRDFPSGIQVDSYQTFVGHTDGPLAVIKEPEPEPEPDQFRTFLDPSETFIPSRPRTPIGRQDSLGFQDRRMMDNELYTFKSTSDINTIRLSAINMAQEPPESEEAM